MIPSIISQLHSPNGVVHQAVFLICTNEAIKTVGKMKQSGKQSQKSVLRDLDTISEDFREPVSANHLFSVNQAIVFIRWL